MTTYEQDLANARANAERVIDPAELRPVNRTIFDGDIPGSKPRDFSNSADATQFEAVRRELDRPLQVAKIAPEFPQQGQSVRDYKTQLLLDLSNKSSGHRLHDKRMTDWLHYRQDEVIADVMGGPARRGELAPIRTIDRTGRESTEWVGPKSAWMDQHKAPAQLMKTLNGKPFVIPTGM
jgi:hypothetical protein